MKDEKFRVVTNGRKMTYAEAIRCKKAVAEQDAAFSLSIQPKAEGFMNYEAL